MSWFCGNVVSGLVLCCILQGLCKQLYSIHCMGEEAEEVLTSTNISAENRVLYGGVIQQFETQEECNIRKSTIQSSLSERRRISRTRVL